MSSLAIAQPTSNCSKLLSRIIFPVILTLLLVILGGCKAKRPTRPTPQMDAKPHHWIRVLLLDDVKTCSLKSSSSFKAIEGECNWNSEAAPEQQQTVFDKVDVPTEITLCAGIITIAGRPFTSGVVTIRPEEPYILNVNGSDYRGTLQLAANADGDSIDVINHIPLEPYLAGVVGAEMPDYWEPEALKAQAIAARTYCLYIKKRFGAERRWDVRKTQAHQVYRGLGAESPSVWSAVNQTRGLVLVCKHTDGTESIFPTFYSSICGGHTENSKNVFGDFFEPLVGVRCPYCEDVARPKYFFWPTVQYDSNEVTEKLSQNYPTLRQLGTITEITVAEQSNYEGFSRPTKVKLSGSTGKSDFLKAEDLRLTVDPTGRRLRSTTCEIVKSGDKNEWAFSLGRGYGHSVGMCQCGAQGMARRGINAKQILSHYYPGSKVISIY